MVKYCLAMANMGVRFPSTPPRWPIGEMDNTQGFHPWIAGSIPALVTIIAVLAQHGRAAVS